MSDLKTAFLVVLEERADLSVGIEEADIEELVLLFCSIHVGSLVELKVSFGHARGPEKLVGFLEKNGLAKAAPLVLWVRDEIMSISMDSLLGQSVTPEPAKKKQKFKILMGRWVPVAEPSPIAAGEARVSVNTRLMEAARLNRTARLVAAGPATAGFPS